VATVLGPLATAVADRITAVMGAREQTGRHLARLGSGPTLVEVRVRQLAYASLAGVGAGGVAVAVGMPLVLALVGLLGAPVLAVLVIEERLASRSREWQHHLATELPVVAEQLGMLLSSGVSLTGAIARLGSRSHGVCARGLAGVATRIRQGVGEVEALREWAELADVRPLDRLVGVLTLNREATDLGGLIAAEARAARAATHRELLEAIDRRGQQVWIPVTVATLVPGVIFMAVPFLDAMRQLTGG
jgi:tight adherence protein C